METSKIPIRTTQESILALEHEILTPDVVELLKQLDLRFEASRLHLLEQRAIRQAQFDAGVLPDFLEDQANAILFLASSEAAYITGSTLPVAGGDLG
jgi:malate synthase